MSALREQVEPEFEEKSCVTSIFRATFYQQYERLLQSRTAEKNRGKIQIQWDRKSMLWKWHGGDNHLMNVFKDESPKEYACLQLQKRIPIAHVLHELALWIERLDRDTDEDENSNPNTRHAKEKNNDQETFDALDDLRAGHDDTTAVPSDTNVFESFHISIATHNIASHMYSSEGIQ